MYDRAGDSIAGRSTAKPLMGQGVRVMLKVSATTADTVSDRGIDTGWTSLDSSTRTEAMANV